MLGKFKAWGISLIAQIGLQFDLCTPQGKVIASFMSVLAEFELGLLRERARSGMGFREQWNLKHG
jgi:DNA invertase Pin-like site-specific DNA recombinase